MKFWIIFLIFQIVKLTNQEMSEDLKNKFTEWMSNNKKCQLKPTELETRFTNFVTELTIVLDQEKEYIAGRSLFRMKLNNRSSDSLEEKKTWLGLKICESLNSEMTGARDFDLEFTGPAPDAVDYRELGYVSEVKDQGNCGCCYAFASLCALEGQIAKKYGNLLSLSEQNIVDCSKGAYGGNWGCDGGFAEPTYQYIIDHNGINSVDSYSYEDAEGACRYDPQNSVANVVGYQRIQGNEEYLKKVLAEIGPLVVGVKCDLYTFYGYSQGIYDDRECYGGVNHAVALVGYGTDYSSGKPVDYWIIKNSWSPYWGENGYIRILRGVNLCNITSYVVYPIV